MDAELDRLGYGYATHLPLLIECVLRTTGPVLEMGAGSFSTPILHELVAKRGRLLLTVENNREWLDPFRPLAGLNHVLAESVDQLAAAGCLPERLSVVLIDSAPAQLRAGQFEAFARRADYLVCHDWLCDAYGWPNVFGRFKSVRIDTNLTPWTAVLADPV